jgi:hypothetical protein
MKASSCEVRKERKTRKDKMTVVGKERCDWNRQTTVDKHS